MLRRAALVTILLLLPATSGQELPERLEESDAADDSVLVAPDGSTIGSYDQSHEADILGVAIEAVDEGIQFSVRIVDPEWTTEDDRLFANHVWLFFTFGGANYRIDFVQVFGDACLDRQIPGTDAFDEYHSHCIAKTIRDDWIHVVFSNGAIQDETGSHLLHPAQLTGIWAESHKDLLLFFREVGYVSVFDRAPETGTWGGLETPIPFGSGPIQLTTLSKVRSSNGGPDLFLYNITIRNISDEPFTGTISGTELPLGWTLKHPIEVSVQPDELIVFPVIVSTSSSHVHGESIFLNITVAGTAGEATIPLKVHFLDIPTPAGHHPKVYPHSKQITGSAGTFIETWMNTLEEDPAADEAAVSPTFRLGTFPTETDVWSFRNALQLGLDFDLSKPVESKVMLASDIPYASQSLRQRLMYCDPFDGTGTIIETEFCKGSWFPIAEALWVDVDFTSGPIALQQELIVQDRGEFILHRPGAAMSLWVEAANPWLATARITVLPEESGMTLPLYEYVDPAAQRFETDSIRLSPQSITEKLANPGKTVWFDLQVESRASEFEYSINGANAAWAEVTQPLERTFRIAVTVPQEAQPGDYADLYLVVQDPSFDTAVQRVRVDVVDEPQPLESPPTTSDRRQSPDASAALLALALVALALTGRRRCQ